MKVNPNTLHFRLASFYGRGEFYRRTNLCSYFWRSCWGLVMCAFTVAIGAGIAGFLVVDPLMWIVLCVSDWHLYPMEADTIAAVAIWAVVLAFFGYAVYRAWLEATDRPFLPIPAPVREAYRGWKEKYCPVVEIVE